MIITSLKMRALVIIIACALVTLISVLTGLDITSIFATIAFILAIDLAFLKLLSAIYMESVIEQMAKKVDDEKNNEIGNSQS